MRRLAWTTLAMLAVFSRPADPHQLDEYLQAARIALAANAVVLEMSLTPGVAVAPRVLALVDGDGDGQASAAEIDAYARQVLRDVVLTVDGQPIPMTVTRAQGASLAEMSAGAGTIRFEALGKIHALSSGRHQIRLMNTHQPEFSVYLVNALVPSDPAISITAQRRDMLQHSIELDLDVATWHATAVWGVLIVGAFAALAGYRQRSFSVRELTRRRLVRARTAS